MTVPFPFTSGQVLTAAQMNAITELIINDKTASYTLVAGDAGEYVVMNSASATTITVPNSVFTASQVVYIVNKGTANTVVTAGAGTTISTAGSLTVPANGTGRLLALSASAFIFESVSAAWQSWTPTYTGLTLGNGSVTARYLEVGQLGRAYISITLGSTSSMSAVTAFTISNPSTMAFAAVGVTTPIGQAEFRDTGTNSFSGIIGYANTTTVQPRNYSVSGSLISEANSVTSSVPFTWTTGDIFWGIWTYHKA
jgi:hypothetical protein